MRNTFTCITRQANTIDDKQKQKVVFHCERNDLRSALTSSYWNSEATSFIFAAELRYLDWRVKLNVVWNDCIEPKPQTSPDVCILPWCFSFMTAYLSFCLFWVKVKTFWPFSNLWPFLLLPLFPVVHCIGWKYSSGFVTATMIQAHLPPASSDVLVVLCGPPPMIQYACLPNLEKLGYKTENIFAY